MTSVPATLHRLIQLQLNSTQLVLNNNNNCPVHLHLTDTPTTSVSNSSSLVRDLLPVITYCTHSHALLTTHLTRQDTERDIHPHPHQASFFATSPKAKRQTHRSSLQFPNPDIIRDEEKESLHRILPHRLPPRLRLCLEPSIVTGSYAVSHVSHILSRSIAHLLTLAASLA